MKKLPPYLLYGTNSPFTCLAKWCYLRRNLKHHALNCRISSFQLALLLSMEKWFSASTQIPLKMYQQVLNPSSIETQCFITPISIQMAPKISWTECAAIHIISCSNLHCPTKIKRRLFSSSASSMKEEKKQQLIIVCHFKTLQFLLGTWKRKIHKMRDGGSRAPTGK